MSTVNPDVTQACSLPDILSLFEEYGPANYGEAVSQEQHMLQCAYFARRDGEPDEVVLACLLHDIGHLLLMREAGRELDTSETEDFHHERLAAQYLRGKISESIVEPVALHVAAKRYLAATEVGYVEALSPASQASLIVQGGPMNEKQVESFAGAEFFEAALKVRHYDDLGKETDLQVPGLKDYVAALGAALAR